MIQDLVAVAKRRNLFKPVWGRNVRLSNTATKESKPQDLTNMDQYVRRFVNCHHHSSMTFESLVGIVDLDREVAFHAESNSTRIIGIKF